MKNLSQLLIGLGLLLTATDIRAQNRITLSGYVRDGSTGEDLIGATVQVAGTSTGTITNLYGFYSLTIPQGASQIQVSYVGYELYSLEKDFQSDETINVELPLSAEQLEEVVISSVAENANVVNNEMSVVSLQPRTIKQVPAVLGEPDVIRSLQLLPGVTSVADGASGFNVRGGSADQNLILLDEGIIYNSAHLLGLYSVVNPDAIKDVKLYKGGIPAR